MEDVVPMQLDAKEVAKYLAQAEKCMTYEHRDINRAEWLYRRILFAWEHPDAISGLQKLKDVRDEEKKSGVMSGTPGK